MLPQVMGEFRVAADPELRFAPSGTAVGKIRAVASSRKKEGDEWVDDKVCWVNLLGFKQVAENMAESFAKGDLVVVNGRLQTEDWEDKEGVKRTTMTIVVDSIGPSVRWSAARSLGGERKGEKKSSGDAPSSPQDDPWATGPASEEPPF